MKPQLNEEEKQKIKIFAADGQTPNRIAGQLNRSPHTVGKYLQQPEVREEVLDKKAELAAMYEEIAKRTLDSITDEDLKKASLQNKAVSAGICTDKFLLLRGGVPSINIQILYNIFEAVRAGDENQMKKVLGHDLGSDRLNEAK